MVEKTQALLLQKTPLANDDALLVFLTQKYGRTSVFVPKFLRSKQKAKEIDFFRILDLEISEGRQYKRLKSAMSQRVFPLFLNDYASSARGFSWLERIKQLFPEEKPLPENFFSEIIKLWSHFTAQDGPLFDLFFRIKLLQSEGILPRFDSLRGDVFYHPEEGTLHERSSAGAFALSHEVRQLLEFLRRTDFDDFYQRKNNIPSKLYSETEQMLCRIEHAHYPIT